MMTRTAKEFSSPVEIFFLASLFVSYFFWSVHPQIMLLATSLYAVVFLSAVLKFDTGRPFMTGLLLSVAYLTFYGDYYQYNHSTSRIFGYPLYPLLAWPLALTLLAYYMQMLFDVLRLRITEIKIIIGYIAYVALLLFLEYTAYHFHHYHLTSHYASLPFIDCLHAPPFMQMVYFINGFIFFTVYFHLGNAPQSEAPA